MARRHGAVLAIVVAGLLAASAASAQLLTQKAIPENMAEEMVQAALAQCRAEGHHISVAVVDNDGLLKAFARDDQTGAQTIDVAQRKAYTAVVMRRTSGEVGKLWASMTPPPVIPGLIGIAGGVPIKAGNEVIGAIGVSGSSAATTDEACARAGLAKVADKLK